MRLPTFPACLLVLPMLAAPMLAGCPSPEKRVSSSALEVGEMQPHVQALSDGKQVSFDVQLRREGEDLIELDDGDTLTAMLGSATVSLTEQDIDDSPHYVGTLPVSTQSSDDTVLLSLVRRNGRPGAPLSAATLPPPFDIASVAPTAVAPNGVVRVQLEGHPPSRVRIQATGPCVQIDGETEFDVDPVSHIVSVDAMDLHLSGATACDLSLSVRAVNEGTLDPAFSGDRADEPFAAVQQRTTSVQVVH